MKKDKMTTLDGVTQRKLKNEIFASYLDLIGKSKKSITRVELCSTYVEFLKNSKDPNAKLRLRTANFCKDRFCPICSTVRAVKDTLKIATIMQEAKKRLDYDFLFITLTAPNVKAVDIKEEITAFNKAFSRLTKVDFIKKVNKGCIRKLEMTYNRDRDDFHPHFHIIMAVSKSYFKSRNYIAQDRLLDAWRVCKRDTSIKQVHITKARFDSLMSYFELGTYTSKQSDIFHNFSTFESFYTSFFGRQVLTYSGIFKELIKELKNKELDMLELSNLEDYDLLVRYIWESSLSKYQYQSESSFDASI